MVSGIAVHILGKILFVSFRVNYEVGLKIEITGLPGGKYDILGSIVFCQRTLRKDPFSTEAQVSVCPQQCF